MRHTAAPYIPPPPPPQSVRIYLKSDTPVMFVGGKIREDFSSRRGIEEIATANEIMCR